MVGPLHAPSENNNIADEFYFLIFSYSSGEDDLAVAGVESAFAAIDSR
jgi:hypothetical protein